MDPSHARSEIDTLIARFFAAFDNRNGAVPILADLTTCFADKALVARSSNAGTDLYSVEDFARPRIALLTGGNLVDFHEAETSSTTEIFQGIAVRTSRYEKSGRLDDADYRGLGTKCFQLVALRDGWKIAALAWTDDDS